MKLYDNKGKQNKAFKQSKTTEYPKVDNYKYLGISLNQKVMPEQHIEHLEKKLNQFRKMIRINKLQGAPTNKIMYLWMVFAESIISYGGFLFSFRDIPQDLRNRYFQIYWKSLIYTLNIAKRTPHDILCFTAGVMQLE